MLRVTAVLCAAVLLLATADHGEAQTRRTPRRAAPPKPTTMVPELTCPTPLGSGATTGRAYCDVMSGRDPAEGILIPFPPHRGAVTLRFDLHNRHTYSEEQVKAGRAFASYTATIGVLAMDNTLLSRAVVQNEFRTASDLIERVGGGAGPSGLKAVAPTGTEHIVLSIPAEEQQVSILGEKLTVERQDGVANYTSAGRPVAVISNVTLEYVPAPVRRAPAPRKSAAPARPAPKP